MNSLSRFKLGGILVTAGASIVLLLKIYFILLPNEHLTITYKLVFQLFGHFFAQLVNTSPYQSFGWTSLLYLPHAAVFIIFLLWIAVKIIKNKFKSNLMPILGVLGALLVLTNLYGIISSGFSYLNYEGKLAGLELLFDLAIFVIILGIGLTLFSYKGAMKEAAMKVCPSCKIRYEDDKKFCKKCGTSLM